MIGAHDIKRARASWERILAMESAREQATAITLWASLYGESLLHIAETRLPSYLNSCRAQASLHAGDDR